ncbi:MAG TPA: carboxypeptidase-like regulatory domain-containing protein, partial [Cytophagaceae bacterium]|nr:carboxypeptidase-like regulatory domain-containing protein [Cytophagaceae bacterium]
MKRKLIFSLLLFICSIRLLAQQVTLKGRVTDAETGETLPYVLISIYNTPYGTETDEQGNYTFQATIKPGDSLTVRYIGYTLIRIPLLSNKLSQTKNFALHQEDKAMDEIVVSVYENPAFAIMRKVIKNKYLNDPRKIDAYRYDNYSKMELSIDNLG